MHSKENNGISKRSKKKEKNRVYKSVFEVLIESVKSKYEEICLLRGIRPVGKGASYYGFGKFKDGDQTLMYVLMNPKDDSELNPDLDYDKQAKFSDFNPDLYKYLQTEAASYQPSPKHLYNLSRESDNKKDEYGTLEVDIILLNILTKFLGYVDFKHFIEAHLSIKEFDKKAQKRLLVLDSEELDEDGLATKYIGFYWSFLEGRSRNVEIWINHYNRHNDSYPIKVVGLHAKNDSSFDGIEYCGLIQETSSCFYAHMEEPVNHRPLTLLGYMGHIPVRNIKYIFTTLSGVSKFGYPFSVEVFLYKLTTEEKIQSNIELLSKLEDVHHIDFYLQMQRRNYRIPPRIVNNLSSLKAKRKQSKEALQLRGQYRLWSMEYTGYLSQSKLIIGSNYAVTLETMASNDNFKKQKCLISFNTTFNSLCISTHNEFGIAVLNYAFLHMEPGETNQVGNGIYCGIGLMKGPRLVGEYLVYIRDDTDFNAAYLKPEDIAELIKINPDAEDALDRLVGKKQIEKRNNFLDRIEEFSKAVYEKQRT